MAKRVPDASAANTLAERNSGPAQRSANAANTDGASAPQAAPMKKRAPRQPPTAEIPPDDLQAVFGRNLRLARLNRGMTLMEVAEAAGMTNQYVSKVENGEKNVTLATMKKLAKVVDHDVSGMIRLAKDEEKSSSPPSKK